MNEPFSQKLRTQGERGKWKASEGVEGKREEHHEFNPPDTKTAHMKGKHEVKTTNKLMDNGDEREKRD